MSEAKEVRTVRAEDQNITDIMVMQPAIIHGILYVLVRRLLNWEFETVDEAKHAEKSIMSFDNVTSEAIECLTTRPFNACSRNLA